MNGPVKSTANYQKGYIHSERSSNCNYKRNCANLMKKSNYILINRVEIMERVKTQRHKTNNKEEGEIHSSKEKIQYWKECKQKSSYMNWGKLEHEKQNVL